jgi:large subunit ribosomal protein L29
MKASEIREMATKEVLEKVELSRGLQAKLRLNHAISPLEHPSEIKNNRKDIARMLTILREREINEPKSSNS